MENIKNRPLDKVPTALTWKRKILSWILAASVAALILAELIRSKKIKETATEDSLETERIRLSWIAKAHIDPRINALWDEQVEITLQEGHPDWVSRSQRFIQFAKSVILKRHV